MTEVSDFWDLEALQNFIDMLDLDAEVELTFKWPEDIPRTVMGAHRWWIDETGHLSGHDIVLNDCVGDLSLLNHIILHELAHCVQAEFDPQWFDRAYTTDEQQQDRFEHEANEFANEFCRQVKFIREIQ